MSQSHIGNPVPGTWRNPLRQVLFASDLAFIRPILAGPVGSVVLAAQGARHRGCNLQWFTPHQRGRGEQGPWGWNTSSGPMTGISQASQGSSERCGITRQGTAPISIQEGVVQFSSENFIYPIWAIQYTAPSYIKLEKKVRKKTKKKQNKTYNNHSLDTQLWQSPSVISKLLCPPEGIRVNSLDMTWSPCFRMHFAFWSTHFFQSTLRSDNWTPIILEQTLTFWLRLFLSFTDRPLNQQMKGNVKRLS